MYKNLLKIQRIQNTEHNIQNNIGSCDTTHPQN